MNGVYHPMATARAVRGRDCDARRRGGTLRVHAAVLIARASSDRPSTKRGRETGTVTRCARRRSGDEETSERDSHACRTTVGRIDTWEPLDWA